MIGPVMALLCLKVAPLVLLWLVTRLAAALRRGAGRNVGARAEGVHAAGEPPVEGRPRREPVDRPVAALDECR